MTAPVQGARGDAAGGTPSLGSPQMGDLQLLAAALPAWAVLAATVGLAVGAHLVVAAVAAVIATAAVLPVRAARARTRLAAAVRVGALCLAVTALLQAAVAGHQLSRAHGPLDELAAQRAVVGLHVVVTGEPVRLSGGGGRDGVVLVRARAERVEGRGRAAPAAAPVLLRGDERLARLAWRERVSVTGRLAPGDPWDAELAVLRVTGDPVSRAPPGVVAAGAEHLRSGLRAATDHLPADARGLLPGLVIGDTSRTPEDLTAAMLATGMTHLTAVSGSNVAVVLGLVLALCTLVGVPRRWRPVLALLALAGFVVLARPEPSVVRAAVMGAIGLIGLSRARRAAGLPVLGGAVVVVLAADPWMSRSYGFALSSLATLGLLLFSRPWGDAVARRLPRGIAVLGPAVAVPVAAQVVCAPVVVLLQGSVSVVGVLANLLAAPLVAPATVAGVAVALLAVVSLPLATVLAWAAALPTLGIARTARVLADVPGGTMPWPDGGRGALLLAALSVAALLLGRWVGVAVARRPRLAVGSACLLVAALAPMAPVTGPPGGWRVVFCDVGQGDAALLRSGPHSAVLVDAGPDPPLVDRCLGRYDVDRLDAVVLTHFHADHVEGLPGALDGREVGTVLATPVRQPAAQAGDVERWTRARGIPLRPLADGGRLDLGDVHAEAWSPARRIDAGSVPNNASVVLAVRVGAVDVLLLGDVEREAAHDLLLRIRRDPAMTARSDDFEAVKTPHHGSANLDEGLMALVRAPVAVVSVGQDNDYGHPTARHLALLRRDGYTTYRTDQRGDVVLVERGGRVGVLTAR